MKLKIFIGLAILGLAAAIWVYFFMYNKPHPTYKNLKPDFTLEASDLYNQFKSLPAETALKYNGKMLAVRGLLTQTEVNDSSATAYFVIEEGMFGYQGVRIAMLAGEAVGSISNGSAATFKGLCTGFNDSDVILEHGSIVH
jgi:hypothetical protein